MTAGDLTSWDLLPRERIFRSSQVRTTLTEDTNSRKLIGNADMKPFLSRKSYSFIKIDIHFIGNIWEKDRKLSNKYRSIKLVKYLMTKTM